MSDRARRIKGLSDKRRMPRLGKIRLGIKQKTAGGKEFPRDVEYFVLPEDDYGKKIAARYGAKPTELDILFPVDDDEAIFPQALAWYGGAGLRCRGDGVTALRTKGFLVVKNSQGDVVDDARGRVLDDDGNGSEADLIQIGCPCPLVDLKGGCTEKAHLLVMLPEISVGGVFQIDTGSVNNIINLNSQLEYVRTMMGRIALVPLKLKRVAETITYTDEAGAQKKSTHYLLRLEIPLNLKELVETRMQGPELALRRAAGVELPSPPDPSKALLPEAATVESPRTEPVPHDAPTAVEVPAAGGEPAAAGLVSGDDAPFPGEPMNAPSVDGAPLVLRLTFEEVDRLALACAEKLGVSTEGGTIGAVQTIERVEERLRVLDAPFCLVALDSLTREEAKTVHAWVETWAAANREPAAAVAASPPVTPLTADQSARIQAARERGRAKTGGAV